ncbi:venom allergen 5-like [Aethina tumida]|uniref:venom allergen 5-like n=1 Tax=Aethina tumida TaxID=116153 RepID=UPI00214991A9|nr:venom allergen 5-like [Aethina tumida]
MLRSVVVFVFVFLFSLSQSKKDVDYCILDCNGETNTKCRRSDCSPVPGCKEEPMTDDIRRYFVDVHNKLRNQLALGEDLNFKDTVSNMRAISYDTELEEMARCHVNECKFGGSNVHDKCRRTSAFKWVGQNVHYDKSSSFSNSWLYPNNTLYVVNSWYKEIIYLDPSTYEYFRYKLKDGIKNEKQVGHFTQLVWADTYKIGCARATKKFDQSVYKHGILFVCNYGPGGNIRSRQILKKGSPCSNCPANLTCNSKYAGLCGEVDKISGGNQIKSVYTPIASVFICAYLIF